MSDQSPPPQYSPDGNWWWNGREWIPTTGASSRPPLPGAASPGPRRRSRWPWLTGGLLALIVLTGVFVAAVAPGVNSARSKAATTATPPAASARAGAVPAGTPGRDGSCAPQPCANDNFGWVVSVSDVKYDAPAGNDFEKPEAGNVFVTLSVTFANKTDKERHASPTGFVLLDGAGVKHTITYMTACPIWDAVNLTPGATLGPKCLAFEGTAGKATGLTLVWTPNFLGGDYKLKLS